MKKNQKGFSLIELLIVVAIILIIAAIAIPNLLKSRIAANEASAVGAIRTLVTSEITYFTSNNTYTDLTGLGPTKAGLIDSVLAGGTKSGYTITIPVKTATDFVAAAKPVTGGTSGVRSFCSETTGVLRFDPAGGTIADQATCIALAPMQ